MITLSQNTIELNALPVLTTEFLQKHLPKKIRCCFDYFDQVIRNSAAALTKYPHIQVNHKIKNWLIFDIDQGEESDQFWKKAGLPKPTIITKRKTNGNCHYLYLLNNGVKVNHSKSYAFFKHINRRMTALLKADKGYSGLFTHNPLDDIEYTYEYTDISYDLNDLHDYLPPEKNPKTKAFTYKRKKKSKYFRDDVAGYGRNCEIFEHVRFYAYSIVNTYKSNSTQDAFYNAIYKAVDKYYSENFSVTAMPFSIAELTQIAKSISVYCWTKYTGSWINRGRDKDLLDHLKDPEHKQTISALATARQRTDTQYDNIIKAVSDLLKKNEDISRQSIADNAKISKSTVDRYMKGFSFRAFKIDDEYFSVDNDFLIDALELSKQHKLDKIDSSITDTIEQLNKLSEVVKTAKEPQKIAEAIEIIEAIENQVETLTTVDIFDFNIDLTNLKIRSSLGVNQYSPLRDSLPKIYKRVLH